MHVTLVQRHPLEFFGSQTGGHCRWSLIMQQALSYVVRVIISFGISVSRCSACADMRQGSVPRAAAPRLPGIKQLGYFHSVQKRSVAAQGLGDAWLRLLPRQQQQQRMVPRVDVPLAGDVGLVHPFRVCTFNILVRDWCQPVHAQRGPGQSLRPAAAAASTPHPPTQYALVSAGGRPGAKWRLCQGAAVMPYVGAPAAAHSAGDPCSRRRHYLPSRAQPLW